MKNIAKYLNSPTTMKKEESKNYLRKITRSIKDYPKEGIVFRDLTTVFQDEKAMEITLKELINFLNENEADDNSFYKFVGIEARGFVLAGALSGKIGGGVILARKPGKLPHKRIRADYMLEYGKDALEMHIDAIKKGDKVIVVDDLLATGGTAAAACKLVEELGGVIIKVLFLVELPDLNGREKLAGYSVKSVISFEGE